jgi:Na+/proline symporter
MMTENFIKNFIKNVIKKHSTRDSILILSSIGIFLITFISLFIFMCIRFEENNGYLISMVAFVYFGWRAITARDADELLLSSIVCALSFISAGSQC